MSNYRYQTPIDPLALWHAYLDSLSWQKGSLDESGNRAFLRAGSLGVPPEIAFNEVAQRITGAGDRVRLAKLNAQLASAYRLSGQTPLKPIAGSHCYSAPPKWPATDWDRIEPIVRTGASLYELWEVSPLHFNDYENHAEEIIDCLFPTAFPCNDVLLCTGLTKTDFATRLRSAWRGELTERAYIVPNPMLSVWGKTAEGKMSQHSLEATAAKIYQVVEFDFRSPTDQPKIAQLEKDGITIADLCAALLWYLASSLPLACVTSSGGRSLHGWFRVVGLSELRVRAFMTEAVRLGADPKLWCRSQFTRLPDGRRETGHRQTCFYLNSKNCVSL